MDSTFYADGGAVQKDCESSLCLVCAVSPVWSFRTPGPGDRYRSISSAGLTGDAMLELADVDG